jgi:hypothetical protein
MRTEASAPGFRLDEGNAQAAAGLCRRLDGIPLALELAATRVRTLGVHEVLARLDDRFQLLATGHRDAPGRLLPDYFGEEYPGGYLRKCRAECLANGGMAGSAARGCRGGPCDRADGTFGSDRPDTPVGIFGCL